MCFDFANIRYATATHIGTWAIDKLIRFALIPLGDDPIIWDFGFAARHRQLYNPWLDHVHRGGHAHDGSPDQSCHDGHGHGSRRAVDVARGDPRRDRRRITAQEDMQRNIQECRTR